MTELFTILIEAEGIWIEILFPAVTGVRRPVSITLCKLLPILNQATEGKEQAIKVQGELSEIGGL